MTEHNTASTNTGLDPDATANDTQKVEPAENEVTSTAEASASASEAAPPADDLVATAQAEAKKYLDAWQRERAEFVNYKKRVERERAEAYDKATQDVMKLILPVIDDFERAVQNIPAEQRETPWVEGTVAIERKLQRLLDQFDIETLDPAGEPFNPDQHQALGVDEDAEVESGHVSQTLQKGYRKGDNVLRPALVRVAG